MLQQMGVTVPAGATMQLKNVAAVMVTAQLPPFAQPGQTLDVNVSSLGNAKSLRGGTLIATPLKGADGQIYALAQGNLIVGGAGASAAGSRCRSTTSPPGASRGATVERSVPTPLNQGETLQLDLAASDYGTARATSPRPSTARWARASPRRSTAARCACACRPRRSARGLPGRHREPAGGPRRAGRARGDQRTHRLHRRQ